MFENNDEQYLLRVLSQNKVILFLGAGFSSDAVNSLGSTLPVGGSLATDLWGFLGYPGEYDGTPLPDMYEAVISSGLKESRIEEFMEERLICANVPQAYDSLTKAFWYRIYTTNVDDLPEIVFRRANLRLQTLHSTCLDLEDTAPGQHFPDRSKDSRFVALLLG